jgi:hypothetical protein
MAQMPSLSGLKRPERLDEPSPDPEQNWEDRTHLVNGRCRIGTPEQTGCYDAWSSRLVTRINEDPTADTVVLLSVGSGVLELRTLLRAQELRRSSVEGGGEPRSPIKNVWLVDPHTTWEVYRATIRNFKSRLSSEGFPTNVAYFIGRNAYARAMEKVRGQAPNSIGVIGALNYSLGLVMITGGVPDYHFRTGAFDFVKCVHASNERLRVVSAWFDGVSYKNPPLDQTASEYLYELGMLIANGRLSSRVITRDERDAEHRRLLQEFGRATDAGAAFGPSRVGRD